MGMFEHFPYTNFHDLNLDWILRHIKSLKDRLEDLIKEYNKTKVPGGGLANQVLTKKSDSDYDMIWKDSSGIPAGGSAGDILTKNSAADYDASWHADNNLKKSGGTLDNAATLEFVDGANSATIGANEIRATGEKFQFSGDFGFTNPVSGRMPRDDRDLATKLYVDESIGGVDGVPAGGTTGQVLAKKTDANGDTEWVDQSGGVPAGGTTGQVLAKKTNADGDTEWVDQSGGGDFLPLAGGTMNEISEIKWTPEFKIGVDETGTKNAMFRGASVDCRRITLVDDTSNKFLFINQDGFDQSGLHSAFQIPKSFPTWLFNNDVRSNKVPEGDTAVVNKKYADSIAVPVGGTTGQVLGKKSNSDRDCEWINAPTPDIPNLNNAFAYQLPYIYDTTRTELPGFFDDLTTHFKTTYGIMDLTFNNPGAGGNLTDTDARYCVGIPVSVYVALGATTTIPLYGISDGAMKKVATLELPNSRQAFITLADGIVTSSALSAYISVSDFKKQTWFN